MADTLSDEAFDILFREARTRNGWEDRAVGEDLIRAIYDIAKMGPTSANCSPLRVVFVTSAAGKEKLKPALLGGNVDKTMNAPVTAIFAHDLKFYELLPELFPHTDAQSWFTGNDALIEETAFRNGTLQSAYFMIAARGLGISCGPMSGFDQAKVNESFFPNSTIRTNFLCNLGYGTDENLFPRLPRLDFDRICRFE